MNAWFFHRGALGDSVLLWPRLRHLVRSGASVTLITDRAKADWLAWLGQPQAQAAE